SFQDPRQTHNPKKNTNAFTNSAPSVSGTSRIPSFPSTHPRNRSPVKKKNRPRATGNQDDTQAPIRPKNSMQNMNCTTNSVQPHGRDARDASEESPAWPCEAPIAGDDRSDCFMGSPRPKNQPPATSCGLPTLVVERPGWFMCDVVLRRESCVG